MPTFKERLFITPGYLARRVHQRAVAIYTAATREKGLTPVQYIVLNTVAAHPGIDFSSLGELLAVDPATTGSVARRLAERGLIELGQLAGDKRAKSATITDAGKQLKYEMQPIVEEVQRAIVSPLTDSERTAFFRIARKLIGIEADGLDASGESPGPHPSPERRELPRAIAVVGVDRPVGRLVAERLGVGGLPLVVVSRDGNHARDLANLMRVHGSDGVESRSGVSGTAGGPCQQAAGIGEAVRGARAAVFCGWGDDRDGYGVLAVDTAALDGILQQLAGGGGGICVVCGPLAAAAPALDELWSARATRVVGIDPGGRPSPLIPILVEVLLSQTELPAGSLLRLGW